MSEKPQKRLVSWNLYLSILVRKGLSWVLVAMMGYIAFLVFRAGGMFLWWGMRPEAGPFIAVAVVFCGVLFTLGGGALWVGYGMFKQVKNAGKFAPITRHNTGHLPEVETLVRGADLPPAQQQVELLRAAKPGQETPPEELLRATIGNDNRA